MQDEVRLSVADATALGEQALRAIGFTQDEATVIAAHLIDAALCGLDFGGLPRILTIYGSYSPSDSVLVSASLPFVQSRYRGAGGGGHDTEIDNGSWHDTFTDLILTAHMQVANGPAAFAPYVGAVIPTNDYVVAGHAAPGRVLQEYWLGFYAALSIN